MDVAVSVTEDKPGVDEWRGNVLLLPLGGEEGGGKGGGEFEGLGVFLLARGGPTASWKEGEIRIREDYQG